MSARPFTEEEYARVVRLFEEQGRPRDRLLVVLGRATGFGRGGAGPRSFERGGAGECGPDAKNFQPLQRGRALSSAEGS